MKRAALALTIALLPLAAIAQTSPNLSYGQVPTAGQWNGFLSSKQDLLNYTPLNRAGGTMSGKLNTNPSTINGAGFSVPFGIAPSVPSNGDIWTTTAGLFVRLNGVTIGPLVQAGAADPAYTVATLPTCNTSAKGLNAYVTDAASPTYNGALTGGGAVVVPVFCSGVAWTAH